HQTIESQLAELRRYAQAHDLAIAGEFVDDGYSGTLLARPGLDALRDKSRQRVAETVLCLSPDRLSRTLVHLGILLEELQKNGTRVEFTNQRLDDTPEGTLLLQIQGAVGEYERAKILDRTRRGRYHKARNGAFIGGVAGYGYTYVPAKNTTPAHWEINEAEAVIVRDIYGLLIEKELTLAALGRELETRGIPTRKGNKRWCRAALHKILTSEAYIGTAHLFKTFPAAPERPRKAVQYRKNPKTSRGHRERQEWVPIPVPAMIDRETYDRAQAILQRNAHLATRNNKRHPYLLRGLVKCGTCGKPYIGGCIGGYTYYSCTRGPHRTLDCKSRYVRTDRIEPSTWESIRRLLDDPDLILEQFEKHTASHAATRAHAQAKHAKLERQLKDADAEEMRVVRLYREEKISDALLDAQLKEISAKRDNLKTQIAALTPALDAPELTEGTRQAVRTFTEDLRRGLDAATFEEKRKILLLLVDRIEINADAKSGTLYGVIPLPKQDSTALRLSYRASAASEESHPVESAGGIPRLRFHPPMAGGQAADRSRRGDGSRRRTPMDADRTDDGDHRGPPEVAPRGGRARRGGPRALPSRLHLAGPKT
ncbi:MAG TPA: recombinase family protein, partial [Armatimonadota bacterium]|nr:recombinase family protein [Armatimonadota bacterium]